MGAVQVIVNYITKYQNNIQSSFLFMSNFGDLLDRGTKLLKLLKSNVFVNEIECEGWPATHINDEECLRPYNENMFLIMHDYRVVYPEEDFKPMDENDDSMKDTSKLVKIKYTINILPSMGYHMSRTKCPYTGAIMSEFKNSDINICDLCANSDEIDIFKAASLQDLIAFKFDVFGKNFHLIGCIIHFIYMGILFFYLNKIYIHGVEVKQCPDPPVENDPPCSAGPDDPYNYVLLAGVVYPACYEIIQMCKGGVLDYITDTGNYIDLIYIYGSIAMSFVHGSSMGPYAFVSKVLMCLVALLAIRRTFNFLRIFSAFSPIVTMLTSVIW